MSEEVKYTPMMMHYLEEKRSIRTALFSIGSVISMRCFSMMRKQHQESWI